MSIIFDFFFRKTEKDFVHFREKPASAEEREIAAVIEEFMRDVNGPPHNHTHDYFTADARIRSTALGGASYTPEEVHTLKRRLDISFGDIFLDDALISVDTNGTEAHVSGALTWGDGAFKKTSGRVFHLVRSERWRISAVDWYAL